MIEEKKQEDIVATVKLVNKNYKQNKKKKDVHAKLETNQLHKT